MFKEKNTEEIIGLVNMCADNVNLTGGVDFASKKDEQNLNVQTDNFDMNIKNNEITINVKEKENHTLKDLQQKLINDLYKVDNLNYDENDIDILKILFENQSNNRSEEKLIKNKLDEINKEQKNEKIYLTF